MQVFWRTLPGTQVPSYATQLSPTVLLFLDCILSLSLYLYFVNYLEILFHGFHWPMLIASLPHCLICCTVFVCRLQGLQAGPWLAYIRLVSVVFVFVFVSLLLQVGKCRGVRLISPGSAVGPKARQDGGALCLSLITLSERSLLQLLLSECEICSNGQAEIWKMSSILSLLPFEPW